ncbi:MAG: amino acid adenylation domain-containing protein [Armatimonadota bacterium]
MSAFLLSHLLSDAALRFPERVAVTDARGSLSYAQLERRANRVANILAESGVAAGDRVGLYLNKSVEAIAGIYGILKSGAAYVPLDPFAPPARLAYIARNCEIHCLVTGREKSSTWAELLDAGAPVETLLVINGSDEDAPPPRAGLHCLAKGALERAPEHAPTVSPISQDLAYILYTSGSTGQPKGVMISHLNALTFVRWCYDYFQPVPEDVFSNHAPLHFDLTILDIYVSAMAGAALVIVPPEASVFPVQLASFIERHGITLWYSVPSVLSMLALHANLTPGRMPALRHMIFAGEVFPTKHLRNLMKQLPHAQFTNLYGPTETNVCTYYRVPPLPDDQTEPIPIGRAIDDVEVIAVSEDGQPVAPGEIGELHVRGATVAYGYWGDPEKTAKGFPTNPLGPATDRIYRTGDLVRENGDGDYFFLGRKDHQIKSRGYRIEIGDIEAALYAHPDVAECAVIPIPDDLIGNRIKAFVVVRNTDLTDGGLAGFCATLLPKYMIPELFEFVSILPKTSTGKVDRTALASGMARV